MERTKTKKVCSEEMLTVLHQLVLGYLFPQSPHAVSVSLTHLVNLGNYGIKSQQLKGSTITYFNEMVAIIPDHMVHPI